jgi:methyl-accepting chemotaxis protein
VLVAAETMRAAQLEEGIAIRDFVSHADVAAQREARKALAASEKAYADGAAQLQTYAAGADMTELRALAATLAQAQAGVTAKVREAIELADNAEFQQAQAVVYREARPLQSAIGGQLTQLTALATRFAKERGQAARQAAESAQQRMAGVVIVALLVGIAATWWITRGIVRPLGHAVEVAERVARGDLSGKLPPAPHDETGRVITALGNMREGLRRLANEIRRSAALVSEASEEIYRGNTDLAARTEEQAASLEETAASAEQLTATVKQNSENAGRASALARDASRMAEDGGRVVGSVVETMDGIHASSRQISEIVGLIEGIAFQTNLLALNAAVEAARAGEHGRGFAVVAAEVRDLSRRCSESAKQIRNLVRDAVGRADAGAKLAGEAGKAMAGLVDTVKGVSALVAEIAGASEEQRSGIEQVNTTIGQLESVTQRNAALVERINAMTDSLLNQSHELLQATSRFRLEEGDGEPGPMAREAAVAGSTPPALQRPSPGRPALAKPRAT